MSIERDLYLRDLDQRDLYLREDMAALLQREHGTDSDVFAAVAGLQGEMFRAVKDRRTFRFQVGDRSYFAKIHQGVGWAEIFKNLLSLRKPILGAENEWRAINALQALDIPTMCAAGFGQRGRNPARRFSFLITDELKPVLSLETVCAGWPEQRPTFQFKYRLLMEVARISRVLHGNGICHRDFYLCHFLLHCAQEGVVDQSQPPRLSVIDLHRALIRPALLPRWIKKDIAGLYFSALDIGLTRTDICRFIKAYTGQPLQVALSEQAGLWRDVENKAHKVWQRDLHKKEQRLQRQVYRASAQVSRYQSAGHLALCNRSLWTPALQALIDRPDELMRHGMMLKDGDSTTVVAVTLDGREWVIKRYNLRSFFYACSRLLRPSRAWHCWGSAFRLAEAGIATPTPLLMLEQRWGPLRRQAWFVTERVAGPDALQALEAESVDAPVWQQALARFETLFKRMQQNRLVHGDMKATNFVLQPEVLQPEVLQPELLQPGKEGSFLLQVLDLDAARLEAKPRRFQKYFARDLRRFYANWHSHAAADTVQEMIVRVLSRTPADRRRARR